MQLYFCNLLLHGHFWLCVTVLLLREFEDGCWALLGARGRISWLGRVVLVGYKQPQGCFFVLLKMLFLACPAPPGL